MCRSSFSNTFTFTEVRLRILSKKYDVLSNRYLENHYLHQLNDTPNLDYLGHPINAYHFIRHVASGWKRILNDGPQINNWMNQAQFQKKKSWSHETKFLTFLIFHLWYSKD